MSQWEEGLNRILGDPGLLQQIASMAQAMEAAAPEAPAPGPPEELPASDPRLLQELVKTIGQTGIDHQQRQLLQALGPYLSRRRLEKLRRAMEAARLAGAASAFIHAGGLEMLRGR